MDSSEDLLLERASAVDSIKHLQLERALALKPALSLLVSVLVCLANPTVDMLKYVVM